MPREDASFRLPGFLVRQPLLDSRCRAVGQDFGLRGGHPVEVLPGAASAGQARDEHLIAAIADLSYRRALGNRLTLVGLAPESLDNPMLGQLPRGQVALPVPFSLSDPGRWTASLAAMELEPLLDDNGAGPPAVLPPGCASARLDCGRHDAVALGELAGRLRRLGARRLLAGNVDSEETFEVCRRLGFDLYQGDFFLRPRPGAARRMDGGIAQVMELLNLAMERADMARMEAVFKRDASLTYRLLRYINSPANGLDRAMQSIGQALLWLGHEPLYRWLTLLLFSSGAGDGRQEALLKNAVARARFMENLGDGRLDAGARGGLFIVGVLSHVDALLNLPMAEALAPLNLPEAMASALHSGTGVHAPYLELARACERFDQTTVAGLAGTLGLSQETVNLAHVDALIWAESLAE